MRCLYLREGPKGPSMGMHPAPAAPAVLGGGWRRHQGAGEPEGGMEQEEKGCSVGEVGGLGWGDGLGGEGPGPTLCHLLLCTRTCFVVHTQLCGLAFPGLTFPLCPKKGGLRPPQAIWGSISRESDWDLPTWGLHLCARHHSSDRPGLSLH